MASKILNELEKSGQTIRKYYQLRLPSDSSKDYYYVLRDTPNTEAIIVEYGFLDNASDAERLKNNYKEYAEAVVRAVADYGGYKYVPVAGSGYYVVKKGDTLWSIASSNGISVDELKKLNNLTSNNLNIGNTLLLKKAEDETEKPNDEYYVVSKGDSLWSIARKFDLTVDELKKLNNLTSNLLSIGQNLLIKERTATSSNIYTVKKGDTLYGIANLYNVSVADIKSANGLTSNILNINQQLKIPGTSEKENEATISYTVQKGDTLYNIAKKYNTTVNEIKSLNNLTDNVLSIGQKILLPS